jgi:hypothetical protein
MRIWFERIDGIGASCVKSPGARWHALHGWLYNVLAQEGSGPVRKAGVFYVSQVLAGCGMVHFEANPKRAPSAAVTLAAMRKGVRICAEQLDETFACIERGNGRLLKVAGRLGFDPVCALKVEGADCVLLKLFGGGVLY